MKEATLALIIRSNSEKQFVLLGEKKQGEIGTGKLNGPGGKQKPGETLEECLIREVEEEAAIGLDPERLEKVAIITTFNAGTPDFRVHVYRTAAFVGGPTETEDMLTDWYRIDDLPYERMHESDKAWFLKALTATEPFAANVYYNARDAGFESIEFTSFEDE